MRRINELLTTDDLSAKRKQGFLALRRLNALFENFNAPAEEILAGLIEVWGLMKDPAMLSMIASQTVPRLCALLLGRYPPDPTIGIVIISIIAALLTRPRLTKSLITEHRVFDYVFRFHCLLLEYRNAPLTEQDAERRPKPPLPHAARISSARVLKGPGGLYMLERKEEEEEVKESREKGRGRAKAKIEEETVVKEPPATYTWRFVGLAWGTGQLPPGSDMFVKSTSVDNERRWLADDERWMERRLGVRDAVPPPGTFAASAKALTAQWHAVEWSSMPDIAFRLAGGALSTPKVWQVWKIWPVPFPKLPYPGLPPALGVELCIRTSRMFCAALPHLKANGDILKPLLAHLVGHLHDVCVDLQGLESSQEEELDRIKESEKEAEKKVKKGEWKTYTPAVSALCNALTALTSLFLSNPETVETIAAGRNLNLTRIGLGACSRQPLLSREEEDLRGRYAILLCSLVGSRAGRHMLLDEPHMVWMISELVSWALCIEPIVQILRRVRKWRAATQKVRSVAAALKGFGKGGEFLIEAQQSV